MPVDPSIALGVKPAQFDNPLAIAMQMQNFRASQESAAALAESRRAATEARERATADQTALDNAITPDATLDQVLTKLPGHMHAAVRKQWGDADKAAQDALDAKTKAANAEADYFGTLAATVKSYGYDPTAAQIVLSHAKAQGHDTAQIEALLKQNPNGLKGVVDGMIAASPKQRELANAEAGTAETGRHNLTTEGLTASGQAETGRHNLIAEAATTAAATEAKRHNRIEEAQGAQRLANEQLNAADLTPEGLDVVAKQFAMTGTGLERMPASMRAKVINRAGVLYSGLDIASQRAAYEANKGALSQMQKQRDAIGAFESTALKNLDVFLDLAKKVPDTGSPALNVPIRKANEKMFGSADLAAYNAARRTVIPEFAKILNNPTLSGQLSDSARAEIETVVSGNATLKQTIAVANLLKTDAANRRTSMDDQIGAIQKRIATPPGQQSPAPVDTKAPAGAPKVGDVVLVAGKQVKISAIHPDGSFDGDEVKR